ncbi:T9SS type A sorting domain-containing protein [Paucihalobacter sp.]|uniref:T9SS type A sorting domain-containing protein n=1 Tax=Paucihalobacter sp. TaxID=2850405 RepID=UPI002FE00D6B
MKKITLNFISILTLSVCLLFTVSSSAQVFYSESWTDSGPGLAGWTNAGTGGNFSRAAAATVCDGAGARANIFSAGNVKQFISPLLGISDGGLTTFEFEYKVAIWSANTTGAPGTDFTIDIEWAIDLAGPWLNLGQINDANHAVSGDCAPGPGTYQFTPNVGDEVYVRFVITRLAGDNFYNFDNVTVQEPITSAPNCDATLTATTEVGIAGDISWSAATGAPNAYDLTVGTTAGGSEVLATTDVGNVTSFNVGMLEFSTTYYVTIVPKNDNGSATGCVEQTFVTKEAPAPPTVDIVFDLNSCGDSDSYEVSYSASDQPFVWVQLNYAGGCDSITVDTLGSTGSSSGGRLDTEIGLYDSNGLLIGDNDDLESGNVLSSLTVASLPAGTYYIVAGPFNTVFGAEDFNVTTTNTTRTGNLFINASTPSNETAEFVNLQFPFEATIEQGSTATIFAQIFKSGITEPAGQGAGIEAWIGVSDTDATTAADFENAGWNWVPATYNVDNGNNDEYQAEIGVGLVPGTYYYVSRFSVLGGPFSYGGINPGASDGNFWDGTNFVSGVLTVTAPPPPVNDNCIDATEVTAPSTTPFSTLAATTDGPGAICGTAPGGPNVWFKFTATGEGSLVVSTCNDADFDTKINVYSGECGALVCEGGNDDAAGCSLTSELTLNNLPSGDYYIAVSGFLGATGTGNLTLNFTLSNSDFDSPSSFSFFPNPVLNTLTLTAQNNIEQVTVFNMLGQAVLKLAPNNTTSEVDMNNLVSGTYFAQVTVNGIVKTVKVVKQ